MRLRRILAAVLREFTPPAHSRLRTQPTQAEFARGHLTAGMIEDAVEDAPGEAQGADTLVISAEVPGHEILRRQVMCPLPSPGSGRGLVGRTIGFRHTTLDPDFVDDVLVARWPKEVRRSLGLSAEEPGVPGGVWRFLGQCAAVITVGGVLLTVAMLIGLIATGGEVFADLPAWFRPGIVLVVSVGAVMLGPLVFVLCESRARVRRTTR